jgi:hypothetical protein
MTIYLLKIFQALIGGATVGINAGIFVHNGNPISLGLAVGSGMFFLGLWILGGQE